MGRYNVRAVGVVDRPGKNGQRLKDYVGSNRMWGDEWEIPKLLDVAISMKGYNTGGTVSGGATVGAAKLLAEATFKRLIAEGLQTLMIDGDIELSIASRDTNLLWADTVGFKTFYFNRTMANEQYKKMMKHIGDVGLNYMGPLMDMVFALSEWIPERKQGRALMTFSYDWS